MLIYFQSLSRGIKLSTRKKNSKGTEKKEKLHVPQPLNLFHVSPQMSF